MGHGLHCAGGYARRLRCKSAGTNGGSKRGSGGNSKRGYLVVGLSADYAPLEFHATLNGADTIVGADISMSKQIAEDMGVKLQIKEMNFTALIGALKTGKIDLIVSGMSKPLNVKKQSIFQRLTYMRHRLW